MFTYRFAKMFTSRFAPLSLIDTSFLSSAFQLIWQKNTDTNTHTKLFEQLQIQIRTASSLSLLLQNFPSRLSFVYLYLYVLAAKRCQDSLVLLFSLLPLANVWIGEENLNSSLKFIFPKHRQETINQLGENRSPWIGRVFHETRSCLIKVMNYSKKILVQSNSSFLRIISQISVCVCGFGSNTKLTSKFRLKHNQFQISIPALDIISSPRYYFQPQCL